MADELAEKLLLHAVEEHGKKAIGPFQGSAVYRYDKYSIARRLGIGRSTLYRKVREQGLEGILKEVG